MFRRATFVGALLVSGLAIAELEPLPEPLSLSDAISLSAPDSPMLMSAIAGKEMAVAEMASVEAGDDVSVSLKAYGTWIDTSSLATNQSDNDSLAKLTLSKKLYDFGSTDAATAAAGIRQTNSETQHLLARQQHQLKVMRAFFDVILADLVFIRDNEAMSMAFIRADKAREHNGMNRVNDVELLQAEATYQKVRHTWFTAEAGQRAARTKLAVAMGRPNDLVSEVMEPEEMEIKKEVPEFDTLLADIMATSPRLQMMRAQVKAARADIKAARAAFGPSVSGELNAAEYNRPSGSRHPFSASIIFSMPLTSGGAEEAAVAKKSAALKQAEAALSATELEIREEALEHWLKLKLLRIKLEQVAAEDDFRELYLDRARALYELDLKSDLGDAMTHISTVRLDKARTLFDLMMTEAKLAAMAGTLLDKEYK